MNVKKAIKKIASLGMGVTMVGSTIMGAMAYTLSQYPEPFTKEGTFNALMVVGAAAQPIDTIGVSDIATSLQFATKKAVASTTTTTVSVSEGVKLEKTGSHMYLGLSLQNMRDTDLGSSELPEILAGGTLKDNQGTNKGTYDYTQKITVDPKKTGTQLLHYQSDSDAPDAGVYLHLDDGSGKYTYNYTLDFTTNVDYDNSSSTNAKNDLKTNTLTIMGNTYTITDATVSSGKMNKITLLAGKTTQTVSVGTPATMTIDGKEYKVEVLGVTNDNAKCKLSVNDIVSTVDVDDTETFGSVEVGVTDAAHFEGGSDSCQVNVGASKLVLEDGQYVKLNDKDIDSSKVVLRFDSASNKKWKGFIIQAQPLDNDAYLKSGDSWTDPVFGAFKVVMGGEHATREDIKTTRSGKDVTLKFMNYDNKEVELNWHMNQSNKINLGRGDDMINQRIYLEGETCVGTSQVDECKGGRFLAVTSSNVAHVIEISKVDMINKKLDFKDITYDAEDKDNAFSWGYTNASSPTGVGATSIDLSGVGTISLVISNTSTAHAAVANAVYFKDIDISNAPIKTSKEAILTIFNPKAAASGHLFNLSEKYDNSFAGAAYSVPTYVNTTIAVKGTVDSSNSEVDLGYNVYGTSGKQFFSQYDVSKSDSDNKRQMTLWGSLISYDSKNNDEVLIQYPAARAYYDVFVSPITASASTVETSALSEVVAIDAGATKFDTEVSDFKAQNLIIVGGPCVNKAAAEMMGNPTNCAEGFSQGKAMIKLFNHANGKVALLVAGYSGTDTRAACMWLHDYAKHTDVLKTADSTQKFVELSVASLTSVTPSVTTGATTTTTTK